MSSRRRPRRDPSRLASLALQHWWIVVALWLLYTVWLASSLGR